MPDSNYVFEDYHDGISTELCKLTPEEIQQQIEEETKKTKELTQW